MSLCSPIRCVPTKYRSKRAIAAHLYCDCRGASAIAQVTCHLRRIPGQLRMWIGVASHLKGIQPRPFHFHQHAIAHRALDDLEEQDRKGEYHDRVHCDTDQLGEKLTSVAVEQAAHRTRDTVPSVAVGAVGKQTKRQRAPYSARTVHSDRAAGLPAS